MSTIPQIPFGAVSSATAANNLLNQLIALNTLASQGVEALRQDAYNSFETRLIAMNGLRSRIARIPLAGRAYMFSLDDFYDTDQSQNSATLRADIGEVSLRENTVPLPVSLQSTTFSASQGTWQEFSPIFSVNSPNGIPIGTFLATLDQAEDVSMIVFDLVQSPTAPAIAVSVSNNNSSYTAVTSITQSGYRVVCRMAPAPVKQVQIAITPVQPDIAGGTTYSFGITDLSVLGSTYSLSSTWVSKAISINPTSANWQFNTLDSGGIQYYLSMNGGPFEAVVNTQEVAVPTVTAVSDTAELQSGVGTFNYTLPSDLVPSTLSVSFGGAVMPLAPALSGTPIHQSIAWAGTSLTLTPYSSADSGKQFTVSYLRAPSPVTVVLQAVLVSSDATTTPTFQGAWFDEL